jgi:hypothetical protein
LVSQILLNFSFQYPRKDQFGSPPCSIHYFIFLRLYKPVTIVQRVRPALLKPKSYLKLIQLFTMRKFLLSAIFAGMAFGLSAQLSPNSVNTATHGTIYFYQYKPPHYNNTDLFPLIISLHGVGQAGNPNGSELANVLTDGIPLQLNQGKQLEFTWQGKTEGFVLLAPQTNRTSPAPPPNVDSWDPFYVDEMILYGINNLRVDPARIFLTGFSAGGGGVWKYATSPEALANPHKLAGITPASSSDLGTNFCNIGSQQIAVWTFHGGDDDLIRSPTDHYKAQAVNACNPPPLVPAMDTVIANESHNIFNSVDYDFTNNSHYPNVFQWMLKVNRNLNVTTNDVPVPVLSGSTSYTFNLPVKVKDFPVLDGSGSFDPDDIIVDYLWSQTSGPTVNLPTAIRPTTIVADPNGNIGMAPGNYTFVFRVKDYLTYKVNSKGNHTQFATVNVNIPVPPSGHAAPATYAGGAVTFGTTKTQDNFIGSAQPYNCSSNCFSAYNWIQLPGSSGGPTRVSLWAYNNPGVSYSPGAGEVMIGNITVPGTYQFQYSATNQFGETGSDILTITKLVALPVTYAYFNGQNAGNKNVLSWATASEVNSDHFDVQRSTDGNSFNTIGTVNSKGGAVLTTYSFDDNNAPAGVAYYRLSQVDKDGRSSLSQVISINSRRTGIYIEKYPNPVHDNLTINVQGSLNGAVQVIIADMQGKAIIAQRWQKDMPALKKIVGVGSLQNGVYQVIVTIGQDRQVSSFVKY